MLTHRRATPDRARALVAALTVAVLVLALGASAGLAEARSDVVSDAAAQAALPRTVKVGTHWCLTGAAAYAGTPLLRGTVMAAREINQTGYLGKTKIKLVGVDDASDPVQAVTGAQRLVQTEKVSAIVGGCTSNATLAATPIAQAARVPWVVANAIGPDIAKAGGDFIFRTSQPYAPFIRTVALKVVKGLNIKRVAIVYGNDQPSLTVQANDYKAAFESKDVDIQAYEGISQTATDFSAVLTKFAGLRPQPDAVVIMLLGPAAANFALQARNRGIRARFLSGQGANSPDVYNIAKDAAVGMIIPASWFPTVNNPLNRRFVANFRKQYKTVPDLFNANGYAGMWFLAYGIKKANSANGDAIRKALASVHRIQTIYGRMTFKDREGYAPGLAVEIGPGGVFKLWDGK